MNSKIKIKMGIDLLMTVLLLCLGFSGMIMSATYFAHFPSMDRWQRHEECMSFYALEEQTKQITKNESA